MALQIGTVLLLVPEAIDYVRRNDGVLDGLIHLRFQVSHVHDIGMKSRNSVHEFLHSMLSENS